jgi:hypothetical protein
MKTVYEFPLACFLLFLQVGNDASKPVREDSDGDIQSPWLWNTFRIRFGLMSTWLFRFYWKVVIFLPARSTMRR